MEIKMKNTESKLYVIISKNTWNKNGVPTNYKYYGQFNSIGQATKEAFKQYGSNNILRVEEA